MLVEPSWDGMPASEKHRKFQVDTDSQQTGCATNTKIVGFEVPMFMLSDRTPEMQNTDSSGVNVLIYDTCMKLKLSTLTRAVSQAIFHKVLPVLADVNCKSLALMCVYLSAKINDSFVSPALFRKSTGYSVEVGIETRIARTIDFTFDFPDIYALVGDICKALGLQKDPKLKKLDWIFSDSRVNSVNFLGGEFDVSDVCMAVFGDEEIQTFKDVYCVEVDGARIEKVRKALLL